MQDGRPPSYPAALSSSGSSSSGPARSPDGYFQDDGSSRLPRSLPTPRNSYFPRAQVAHPYYCSSPASQQPSMPIAGPSRPRGSPPMNDYALPPPSNWRYSPPEPQPSAGFGDPESQSGSGGIALRRRVDGKSNTPSACAPCKRGHLACDLERPCTRCIAIGKSELCIDLPHKKRGRPKTSATSKPSSQSSPTRRKRQSDSAATTTTINNNNAIGLDILATSPTSTLSNALDTTRISPSADTHPRSRTRAQSVESRSGLTSAASLNRDSTIHFFCNLALTLLEVATNAPDSPPSQDWSGMLDACLADFVHPQDVESFLEARSRALNPRRRVRAGELRFGSLTRKDLKGYSHANLLLEAPGFQQTYCSRRIRFPECSSASYEVRFRVGGCLGANGLEPKTLDKGYFIVSLTNAIEEPTPQRGSTSSSEPNMTPSTSSSNSMPPFPAGTSLPPLSSIVAGLPEPEPRPPWTHLASPSQDLANPLSPRHDPFAKLDRDDRIDRRRRNELPQLLMPTNSFDGLPGGSLSPYPRPPLISPSNLSDSWTPTMMQQSPSSRSNQGSKDSPA